MNFPLEPALETADGDLDYALLEAWLTEPAEGGSALERRIDAVLHRRLGDADGGPASDPLRAATHRLRPLFHAALVGWFQGCDARQHLLSLDRLFAELEQASSDEVVGQLWWAGRAVVEALLDGGLSADNGLKLLFGRIDQQLKRLAEEGEEWLGLEPPAELIGALVARVARAESGGERVEALKRAFDFSGLPLRREEGVASGHQTARLLVSVAAGIQEELDGVKEALRTVAAGGRTARLKPHVAALERMAETLGMLGLTLPRRVVERQTALLRDLAAGLLRPAEEELLGIARALLFVADSLHEVIGGCAAVEERGDAILASLDDIALGRVRGDHEPPPPSELEYQRAAVAALHEGRIDLARVEDLLYGWHDRPLDLGQMEALAARLREVRGALAVLGHGRAAHLLEELADHLPGENGAAALPEGRLKALLAITDAVARYLEAAAAGRNDLDEPLAGAADWLLALKAAGDDEAEPWLRLAAG